MQFKGSSIDFRADTLTVQQAKLILGFKGKTLALSGLQRLSSKWLQPWQNMLATTYI